MFPFFCYFSCVCIENVTYALLLHLKETNVCPLRARQRGVGLILLLHNTSSP